MKVFISWSGDKSRAVAQALHDWIPFVINEAKPFMSADSDSIESGQRWSAVIAKELESTNFGIICTTASNQFAPWLNFEAGALAKQIGDARVAPVAIDLKPSEIKQPLGQFNGDALTLVGIRRLLRSVNNAANAPLSEKLLDPAIDMWWPKLEEKIQSLPEDDGGDPATAKRADSDILLEVLDSVRALVRAQQSPTSADRLRAALAEAASLSERLTQAQTRYTAEGRPISWGELSDLRAHNVIAPETYDERFDHLVEVYGPREAKRILRAEAIAEREADDEAKAEYLAEQAGLDQMRAENLAEQQEADQALAEHLAEQESAAQERAEREAED